MKDSRPKVLLIQADTTQTLPMARSLATRGYEVHAVVSSKWTYGYGCRFIKKKYIFKDYENIEEQYNFILSVVTEYEYAMIIPMADHGAIVLSKYKTELSRYAVFVMPDYAEFQNGYDKHKLMEACEKRNYPHPRTIIVHGEDIASIKADDLKYPVLIKPNISCGARGITYIENYQQLLEKFPAVHGAFGECHIQEYIPAGGKQVKAQLYINGKGKLVQSSVIRKFRWYPNNGGSSCCNASIEDEKLIAMLHSLLKDIKWVGFADFDTIEDPRTGELLIMEINPRVPACLKTAFNSGIDWADVISSEYLGKSHQYYPYKKKTYLRHLGFEILWFLKSKNKFSTFPCWFKFFGKDVFYQDIDGWDDPMAFIRGTLGNIAKQLSPSFRKAKAGMN